MRTKKRFSANGRAICRRAAGGLGDARFAPFPLSEFVIRQMALHFPKRARSLRSINESAPSREPPLAFPAYNKKLCMMSRYMTRRTCETSSAKAIRHGNRKDDECRERNSRNSALGGAHSRIERNTGDESDEFSLSLSTVSSVA